MASATTREEYDHFVRTLSHDLTANFMLLENSFSHLKRSLGDSAPPDRTRDEVDGHVAHMEACLRESKRFLDDLDGLARTGRVEMEPEPVELGAVVEEVLFEQRELLAERGIEVEVVGPLPWLWCNRGRLKQVVTNLVRNAAHHGGDTHNPRITIAASHSTSSASDRRKMAAFHIHDNGPGLDHRFRREIFLPGRRLGANRTGGSGMGLAIVKKIVDYYGGSVHVDPDCKEGTSLVVWLPRAERRRRQLQLDGRHGDRPSRKRPRVLSSRT
ncbi:MAG: HAMP domain-containing histidine kinase [Pirellulales bacterium]|nr:HAMP domain-containing histidine kinase [Pirellulales bacterium]